MAISVVGTASGATDGTSAAVTITLPGGIAEDDIVCVFGSATPSGGGAVGGDPDPNTTGYTSQASVTDGTFHQVELSTKIMGGTPDSSVECPQHTLDTIWGCAYVVMAFSGVDTTTPMDATATTSVTTSNTPWNGPSITTANDNAEVMSLVGAFIGSGGATAPSGYSNTVSVSSTGSGNPGAVAGAASKSVASAGAEDPGDWTESHHAFGFGAITAALRPAAGASAAIGRGLTRGRLLERVRLVA